MSINMKETMNTEQKYITQNDRLKCTRSRKYKENYSFN